MRLHSLLPVTLIAALASGCLRDNGTAPASDTMQARVANDDPGSADDQPDWDQQARELKQRVAPRMPDTLPTDKRAACTAMLDAASEFYATVETDAEQRKTQQALLAQTREADIVGCVRETSVAAAVCVTILLGDRDSEFPWLLDQCSRAYPNDAGGGPLVEPKADQLELTFVGDIIFGRYRDDNAFDPIVEDPNFKPFDEIRPALLSDVVVGNLETPVIEDLPEKSPIGAQYRFGGSRQMVQDYLGDFSVLSLANNHYFDLREDGQTQSPKILSEEGIFPIGASRTDEPLYRVETYTTKGWKIGFLAVTNRVNAPVRPNTPQVPYIELVDMPDTLLPIVEQARAEHDLIIVVVHWGDEYLENPNIYQQKVARKLIEGGVDMVIAHHSHVLQAIERHKDGLIAYSLGNFLFEHTGSPPRLMGVLRTTWNAAPEGAALTDSCMTDAVFHTAINKRTPYPHPSPATGGLAKQVRDRIISLSKKQGSTWAPIDGTEDLRLEGVGCGPDVDSPPAAAAPE
ncbi:CapA family protein [Nannocystaceae bacterium ST9]